MADPSHYLRGRQRSSPVRVLRFGVREHGVDVFLARLADLVSLDAIGQPPHAPQRQVTARGLRPGQGSPLTLRHQRVMHEDRMVNCEIDGETCPGSGGP